MKKYVIEDAKKTGSEIRNRRIEIHLSQAELAAALNVSISALQSWEIGRRTISPRFIPLLLSILKLPAADLAITEIEIAPETPEKPVTRTTAPAESEDPEPPFQGLFACFESLNDAGKAELIRFAEMLRTHPDYKSEP